MESNTDSGKFWQIYLPLLIFITATAAGIYLIITSGHDNIDGLQKSGGIAAIYLLFLLFTPLILTLVFLIFFIIINGMAGRKLSEFFPKLQERVFRINESVCTMVSSITKPVAELDARISIFSNQHTKKEEDGN